MSLIAPYTPAQNGKIEKAGQTFNDQARATYINVGLPTHMWPFAVELAIYVNNLLPTAANDFILPHEKLMGWLNTHQRSVKPFIRHLRAFGCIAYVHLKGTCIGLEKPGKSQKMKPRAVKGHLVGYEGLRGHIFKIWLPEKKVIVCAQDVCFFDEDEDNDEDVQHLVEFEEVREEGIEIEEENLPHFILDKIHINKKEAGNVDNCQTTPKPLSQASKHPQIPSEHQEQGYLPVPSYSELPEPRKMPLGPPPDSIKDRKS